MIALQRPSFFSSYVKTAAGLVTAVTLAMFLFASGLAAMDHVTMLGQRSTIALTGSFDPGAQGDYRAIATERFAPQRGTTR